MCYTKNLTTNILSSTLCRDCEFILNIYQSHIRPLLEYGSPLWNTGYLGDLRLLERIQRRWTRAIQGFEVLPYGERLRKLNLFSVQGRLLRADLIITYKIFQGLCAVAPNDIFNLAVDPRTRGHRFKVVIPATNVEPRKRSFSVRVASWWNGLSDETVSSPSLGCFKQRLHDDLGDVLFAYTD